MNEQQQVLPAAIEQPATQTAKQEKRRWWNLFRRDYKLSDAEQSYANSVAALLLVETLANIQVKTVYGLSHDGVAAMFRQVAKSLADGIKEDMSASDRAGTLAMVRAIQDTADRIQGQQ